MKLRIVVVASAFGLAAGASSANAAVMISDDFDADVATLNWTGDATFVPPSPPVMGSASVDLVGAADGFANLAYNSGVSLDLDGSTGGGFSPAGEIQSVASLATGDYTVSFLLAGNLRGAPNRTTAVTIGDTTFDITPSSNAQPYTLYTENFTNVSGRLTFTELGPADQQGDLLDNIVVTDPVPEPAIWAMLLAGFGAIGLAMRGRRQRTAAI